MRFRILGALEVARGESLLAIGSPRQRAVLALLLIRPGMVVSADRLADELWEGTPPETARHTLQAYVHRLRKALGQDGWRLGTRPPGYRLQVSPDELDALRFQEWVEAGRQAHAAGDPQSASSLLASALQLWRGAVLADLSEVAALQPERARLEEMRLAALEDRVEADLALGRHARLAGELEGLVADHPFRERLWGQLMLALYRSGRQADALAACRRVRDTLGEELGLDPGPELARLEEQILVQDPVLRRAGPRAPVEPPHNLPVQRTSFVGRGRELAELQGFLRARRLVTVTGPPGAGKTRLALEVAARSLQAFPHGMFLVSLAEVEDPELVPSAIVSTLGMSAGNRSVLDALLDYIKPKRMLLVLDNVEHLLPAASVVSHLLDAASGLKVLATGRAPLHLSGEQEYPLGPLPLPEPNEPDLARSDALVLFADRARAVDPRFTLTVDRAPLVAEVVTRLDGLPLAIELAAARLKLFPLGELADRLSPALPLLVEGPIDLSARQRTLRDAIAWSYELLDPADRVLFRRLGAFRGSFTLEAADAVASGPEVGDVLGGVSTLVEMSLLQRPAEAGQARFSMLETIRDYALEQLQANGEEEESRHRHAVFYSRLAERAEPELTTAKQTEWLARLEADRANLRAALGWAQERGETELGLLTAARTWRFWQFRGHLDEGRRWLEDLLAVGTETAGAARVKARIGLAGICYWQGNLDAAEAHYREALSLVEGLGDWSLEGEALSGLAITLACHRGDVEAAAPLERRLHALAEEHQDPLAIGMGVMTSGIMRAMAGDPDGARPYCEQVLAMCRAAGQRWWEGQVLRQLGINSCVQERYEEAENELRGSLEIAWEAGDLPGVASDLEALGVVAVARGRMERGIVLAGAASRLAESVGAEITLEDYLWKPEHPRDAARGSLNQQEIDTAWARGRVVTLEEAVAYAGAAPTSSTPIRVRMPAKAT
jgi:predicted ATPase/DNA-binding SARP family transcriptional activator